MTAIDGRTRHYGDFYGVLEPSRDRRPVLLVWGNCQAEALRVLLGSVEDLPFRTVRVPAAHELTDTDVPHVRRLSGLTAVLVSQPIRSGYRDLPLGTDDIAAMLPPGSRVLRWPVVRQSGFEHSRPSSATRRRPAQTRRPCRTTICAR